MKQPSLYHVVIAVSDLERSNRFNAEVLGGEVVELLQRASAGTL